MLSGKQKRYLRALGHSLKPVITIGKGEMSEALIHETNEALESHELVKVKMLESCSTDRHEAAGELAAACSADVAQVLGRTFLLFRPSQSKKIDLPKETKPRTTR